MNKALMLDRSTRLKQLHYRSWHRGCKETDLVLGQFAETKLAALDDKLLLVYEQFLSEQDGDIWSWLTGGEAPGEYGPLLAMMQRVAVGG